MQNLVKHTLYLFLWITGLTAAMALAGIGYATTAKRILDDEGGLDMKERFDDLLLAVNVLKHGRGRSYNALVAKAETLPFRIKLPDESFFFEGDVSEVSTLVEVDDAFVQFCGDVISDVSGVIRRVHPDFA